MDQRVHEWNCSREALDRDPPPPVFPRAESHSEPAPARAVQAVQELLPSSLPLWPQPTWKDAPRSAHAPSFRMVLAEGDSTVMHAGGWQFHGPGRSLAGGDVFGGDVAREGEHEFTFVLQRTHPGSSPPVVGLCGVRPGPRQQEREWRLGLSLVDGGLCFDRDVLHDEPDISRWPGRHYDPDAGEPANPVKLELPEELPLSLTVRIDFAQRNISFRVGSGDHQHAPQPVLDACCAVWGPCVFQPITAQPFVTFADTHMPCANEGKWPCHDCWCACKVVGSADGPGVGWIS